MQKDSIAHYNLRIDRDLLDKLGFIARSEERSINGELVVMVKRRIAEFEKEHGDIEKLMNQKDR